MKNSKPKNVSSNIHFPHFEIPVEQNIYIYILGTRRATKQDVFKKLV